MNLPNKLTTFRVILIPFFVFFLLAPYFEGYGNYIALLVCSALICLIALDRIPAWIVIVIISREFIISGFRLIAADNGVVIAASYWGKFKTASQMVTVILLVLNIQNTVFTVLGTVFIYISLVLTVVSLIDYIAKNKEVLKDQN